MSRIQFERKLYTATAGDATNGYVSLDSLITPAADIKIYLLTMANTTRKGYLRLVGFKARGSEQDFYLAQMEDWVGLGPVYVSDVGFRVDGCEKLRFYIYGAQNGDVIERKYAYKIIEKGEVVPFY